MTQAAHANLTELVSKIVNLLRLGLASLWFLPLCWFVICCAKQSFDREEFERHAAQESHQAAVEHISQLEQQLTAAHQHIQAIQAHPQQRFEMIEIQPPSMLPPKRPGWLEKGADQEPHT